MPDEDRRKADEQFRIRIIEQLAETKTIVTQGKESLKLIENQLTDHGIKITDIQHALWGGPGIGDIGLLEQHRKTVKRWAIFSWVGVFVLSLIGHLISPIYNKLVADWTYNSVSERWIREQKRPRVRHYKVEINADKPETTE